MQTDEQILAQFRADMKRIDAELRGEHARLLAGLGRLNAFLAEGDDLTSTTTVKGTTL